jgi:predicted small metal-binding protein
LQLLIRLVEHAGDMHQFRCRDMGFDDNFVTTGNTQEEVMNKALAHGKTEHGLKESDLTPDFTAKLKSKITTA